MISFTPELVFGAKRPTISVSGILVFAAVCVSAGLIARPLRRSTSRHKEPYILSPDKAATSALSKSGVQELPYPPDALPSARDVETPYGSIRVYEWGPEDGERVLFVHGISTPVVGLGDLGHEMVKRGCRVMLFDLFGRGYSDAPDDLTYDLRLYVTQLLLVLASSKISWTAAPGFHLVGYSLGGGLCVAFTRYFPHLLRSLALVAPCGLIRRHHVGWWSWLYYNSGLLPEFLVRHLVKRRIRPNTEPVHAAGGADIVAAESEQAVNGDGDSNGGKGFANAVISKTRPHVTVSSVVAWQVDNHQGFVMAFLSTIRNAPIYAPQRDWEALSAVLKARRPMGSIDASGVKLGAGLEAGKILIVLGEDDGVVVKEEAIEDAEAALGRDGVEFVMLPGGHELPFTYSADVAEAIRGFWDRISNKRR
ncbi:alpha/beta-hydrolase [Xylariaceae sp. FL1651]|nr:alpha/beta-hydrolase [Xylariaceae sp. FL1651]